MGFPIVEIRMPEFGGDVEARLQQWLVPVGEYVNWDRPVAQVKLGDVLHNLVCNMPVALKEISAVDGSRIERNQLLARALAEGHEMPYGRPNARLERGS